MNKTIDIYPHHLSIITGILERYLPKNSTVMAFGSRTTGNAKKFSDLDIAIDSKTKLPADVMTNIKFDLEDSNLPYKVDVIDWNDTSEHFKKIISADLVLLWKR